MTVLASARKSGSTLFRKLIVGHFTFIAFAIVFLTEAGTLAQVQPHRATQLQLTPEQWQSQLREAGDHPVRLLRLLTWADAKEAVRLRKRVFQILCERKVKATQEELVGLAQDFARWLPEVLRSPQEATELLGENPKVSRQLLYRSYREQWRYQDPLPLILTFEHRRGQDPVLWSAQVLRLP